METIIYLSIGLLLGGLIGYFMSKLTLQTNYVSKTELEALRTENKTQQDTILTLTKESEQKISKQEIGQNYVSKESFDIVNMKLSVAEEELRKRDQTILTLNNQLTKLQQEEKNLNEKLTTFKTELENLHTLSQQQFKNLATDILEEKKKLFVEENKKELNTILDPLKNDLTQFKEKVEATRKEDIKDLTSLKNEIESLQKLNTQLSDDAKNLATALKSEVKMQGNWGEDRLNMILEVEGLQRYIDYSREEKYRDEEQERNRKPDFILKLPNGKHIIIDSKVSLTAYVNYFNASTKEEKDKFLKEHLKSVSDHIEELADKNYQSLAGLTTPDYVFMFMPVEAALTLALNQNPNIFNEALKRKIVLITPTTLVATLKVVKILWQKENQVKNIEIIFKTCGELYDKFVAFIEVMEKIDTGLKSATSAYADAMYALKDGKRKGSTIIGKFEAIRNLEAKVNKRIPDKYVAEIELLGDDNEVKMLESGEKTDTTENKNGSQQGLGENGGDGD